jgi:small subunit ribosomal protein S11
MAEEKIEEKTQAEEIEEAEAKKAAEEKDTDKTKEGKSDDTDDKTKDKVEEKKEIRKERVERIGVLNIYTTFNNTIMNLTDLSGKSIAKFTGGQSTKQDRLKANPTIAMFIAQRVAEEAKDNGITGFYVKVRAKTGQNNPGPGTHAAIKSLTRAGFKILSIMDTTHVPRGGPKKKGGRRGRRV